jgi:hypothetical protein
MVTLFTWCFVFASRLPTDKQRRQGLEVVRLKIGTKTKNGLGLEPLFRLGRRASRTTDCTQEKSPVSIREAQ